MILSSRSRVPGIVACSRNDAGGRGIVDYFRAWRRGCRVEHLQVCLESWTGRCLIEDEIIALHPFDDVRCVLCVEISCLTGTLDTCAIRFSQNHPQFVGMTGLAQTVILYHDIVETL